MDASPPTSTSKATIAANPMKAEERMGDSEGRVQAWERSEGVGLVDKKQSKSIQTNLVGNRRGGKNVINN